MNRSALVLAAHGSRSEPSVNAQIRALADAIAVRGLFDEVVAAFHQDDPPFAAVLDQLTSDNVTVVPVMTSVGYYSDAVLPRELSRNQRIADISLRLTPPVGTHASMIDLVADRVRRLCDQHGTRILACHPRAGRVPPANHAGDPGEPLDRYHDRIGTDESSPLQAGSDKDDNTLYLSSSVPPCLRASVPGSTHRQSKIDIAPLSLVLVGHGTPRHATSRNATRNLAQWLRRMHVADEVVAVFLDDSPPVDSVLDLVQHETVVVEPFLIGAGPHATRDIPRRIGLELPVNAAPPFVGRVAGRTIICDAPVGSDPRLVDLIIDLALSGCASPDSEEVTP